MQPGRDATGRFFQTLEGAERDREAVRLKSRGWSYQRISDELGYGAHQNAQRAVKATLAAVAKDAAEEHIALQLDRLDFMYEAALGVLERRHYTVSDGRIVYTGSAEDEDREALEDDGPVLKAIDRLLKIEERRAKLLGLDRPEKYEVTSAGDVDDAIARYAEELRLQAGDEPVPSE